MGRKSLERYAANATPNKKAGGKKKALSAESAALVEQAIVSYLLRASLSPTPPAKAVKQRLEAPGATVQPIVLFSDKSNSGVSGIYDVGDLEGEVWQYTTTNATLQIRAGLRGRHLFTQGVFKDKMFEWRIVKCSNSVKRAYQFELYELQEA